MEFFLHFFNGVEREQPVIIPLPLKIGLYALWLGGMAFLFLSRHRLSKLRNPERIAKAMGIILLVDQVVLYSWQFLSGYFNLEMSLPLYHCRIAVPLLILDLVFGVKVLRPIWIFWAALGTVFSMIFMDLYRFDFPHYTNFQFFIVHILLGWAICYVVFVLDYRFEKKGLKLALIVTFAYNIFLILFNAVFNGTFIANADLQYNYGYMLFPPGSLQDFVLSFPPFLYYIIMLIGYELLILLLHSLGRFMNRLSSEKHAQIA
ncbi:MAG: TIGR02206 family membrane protein [Clostridiaceae bacterium]|jgi:hypothetical integral membrane protein (TIGR02206 family)|nr:TIGR02206 family membrane protein [Clostridiaceae bacterium]